MLLETIPVNVSPDLSLSCPRFVTSYHHQLHHYHYHIGSQLVVDIGIRLFLMFQVKIDREIRGSSYPHAWNIVWDPKAVFSLRMSKLLKIGWIAAHWLDSSAVITVTMPSAVGDPEVGRWYNPRDANYRPTSNQTIPHICHFFTRAKFLENKIYTEKPRKLQQNTQKIAKFLRYYGKIHSKLPIFLR